MTARSATPEEIANWNGLIIANPDGGNVFQAKEFADIKKDNNWGIRYVVINNIYILILERKIPILGTFWYIPKGPGITTSNELKILLPDLHNYAKSRGVFVVRLESELLKTKDNSTKIKRLGLINSRAVQAANTVIVDITPSIDDIIASFSPKTRASIRSAQKANIKTKIVPINDKNCRLFYDLMTATINGRSHLRNFEYFKTFWQSHYNANTGVFLFAKSKNKILSMDFIMILGAKATRKDAASSRDHSIRGVSALLEKEAIEYLKTRGITTYDLYGSPPSDQIKNPSHPYYGFGTFKAGFNSNITDFMGGFDLIIKPSAYRIWRKIGERVAHRLYYYQHHDLYY